VPAVFEKAGSVVQRLNIDDVRDTETTDNSRGLNDKVPSAALTGTPAVLTSTVTVNVAPVLYTPVPGDTASVAAYVNTGNAQKTMRARPSIVTMFFAEIVYFIF
jgi:hypothetical protein